MSTKNNLIQQKLFKYCSTSYKVLFIYKNKLKKMEKNRKPEGKTSGRKWREKTARSSIMYGFIFDNFSKKIIGDPYHEQQVERLPPKIYSQRSRIYLFDRTSIQSMLYTFWKKKAGNYEFNLKQ